MADFQREERYIVLKLKRIPFMHEVKVREFLNRRSLDDALTECVVVESDWPIYDETWENVRRMAEGEPSIGAERDELRAYAAALRLQWLKSRDPYWDGGLDDLDRQVPPPECWGRHGEGGE